MYRNPKNKVIITIYIDDFFIINIKLAITNTKADIKKFFLNKGSRCC